jgi:hypothetical protein
MQRFRSGDTTCYASSHDTRSIEHCQTVYAPPPRPRWHGTTSDASLSSAGLSGGCVPVRPASYADEPATRAAAAAGVGIGFVPASWAIAVGGAAAYSLSGAVRRPSPHAPSW